MTPTEDGPEQVSGPSSVSQTSNSLKLRVFTALVAVGISVSVLTVPLGGPVAVLIAAVIWAGAWELGDLFRWLGWTRFYATLAVLLAMIGVVSISFTNPQEPSFVLGWTTLGTIVGAVFAAYFMKDDTPHPLSWLGILWLACPLLSLVALHIWTKSTNPHPIYLAVFPIWAGDTAAYFVGKAFGKRKLAPAISPKKTVEGGIANLLAAVATTLIMAPYFGMNWVGALLIGLSAGVFGQAGDLFESYLKRKSGVKDSGSLLPGHGGILDRIDSILFACIPSCWTLVFFAPHLFNVKQLAMGSLW